MKTRPVPRLSHSLIRFLLASLAAFGLYYALFPAYGRLVLALTNPMLAALVNEPLRLGLIPRGIALINYLSGQVVGLPYDLFSIALNLIFAPALVIATLGLGWGAWLRAAAAVPLMALFHAAHVLTIVLRALADPRNTFVPVDFSATAVTLISGVYTFFDKMGYALLPFLAWLILCGGPLARLLAGQTVDVPRSAAANKPRKKGG